MIWDTISDPAPGFIAAVLRGCVSSGTLYILVLAHVVKFKVSSVKTSTRQIALKQLGLYISDSHLLAFKWTSKGT